MEYNLGTHRDSFLVKGLWDILVVGPNGKVKDSRNAVGNLIVNNGKVDLTEFLVNFGGSSGTSPATSAGYNMTFLAIGTSATAAAATDSALTAEVGTRVNGTKTLQAGSGAINNVYQVQGTFAAGNPATLQGLQEAGLLSASSVGTLFNHVTFSVINKDVNDTLQLTVKVQFG